VSVGEVIRIDDLRVPQLTDVQKLALDHGERTDVDLSVDAVLDAAREGTGLADFGPSDFIERLALWLDEVGRDEERTGLGRLILFNDCVRYASNRLLIHDLLARHPEINDVEFPPPVVVVGLPRSGTTHLVNLIAADTRFRSMPLWESYEPLADPAEARQRADQAWHGMRSMLPHLPAMHPMEPDHVHEEIELQLPDFSSYELEWVARVARWRDYYLAHDQTPHYAYMATVLKILQWRWPRDRWVLKSPQHLEQLGPLLTTFPDATVVVTHRDPVSVVQSAATMMTYAARLNYRHPDPDFYVDYWTDRIARLLRASVRDRHVVAADRRVDVFFDDFMADPIRVVEDVYRAAGLDMTDAARRELTTYVDDHPRGREGRVVYDLRADFGVTPSEVREPFDFYFSAFPQVQVEVT